MTQVAWDRVRAFRLARHALDRRRPHTELLDVVRQINGLHAQVYSAAVGSAQARVEGVSGEEVRRLTWEDRRLVKCWAMRGTLHLLHVEDFPLFMAATRRRSAAYERGWARALGGDPGLLQAISDAAGDALTGRRLTRRQLADAICERLRLSDDQRSWLLSGWGGIYKFPMRAGRLGFAPNQGNEVTFVNYRDWAAWEDLGEMEAEVALLRRYLRANGPATRLDYQRWLGATPAVPAWKALQPELATVEVEGRQLHLLAKDLDALAHAEFADPVRLLPLFDHLLLTHVARDHMVAAAVKPRIFRTAGWVSATVLLRGQVVGVWQRDKAGAVEVELFKRLAGADRKALDREVELTAALR